MFKIKYRIKMIYFSQKNITKMSHKVIQPVSNTADYQQKVLKQKSEECYNKKTFVSYTNCLNDVLKWAALEREPLLDHFKSQWVFTMYKRNYSTYPIDFQMRLLLDIYVNSDLGIFNQRKFNAVLRKIYRSETKEIKWQRTEQIRKELTGLNLIQFDENDKEYVIIYRGINQKSMPVDIALSWTYNVDVARFFGSRLAICNDDKTYKVLQGKIFLKDILKIEHDRDEDEIIVFPHKTFDISVIEEYNSLNITFKNTAFNK